MIALRYKSFKYYVCQHYRSRDDTYAQRFDRLRSDRYKIKVEPSVAMVKDILVDNIGGHVIYFVGEAAGIAKSDGKDKNRPVVGMPVVSVKIGELLSWFM